MPFYSSFHRPVFLRRTSPSRGSSFKGLLISMLIIALLIAIIIPVRGFLRDIAGAMALSDAVDMITVAVNDSISERMRCEEYDYEYFVTLEKDDSGAVTAISANMARINALSSEILKDVIGDTGNGELELALPIGNLLGSNLTLGRGPKIPVKIIMLTSSYADFRNEIGSAGINQLRHQIILELRVDIDVLLPWEMKSTQVLSEVLIAETIIVGKVPDTYLNVGEAKVTDGYKNRN